MPDAPLLDVTTPDDVVPSPQLIRAVNWPGGTATGLVKVATFPEKVARRPAAMDSAWATIGGADTAAVLVSETDLPSSSLMVEPTVKLPGRAYV